jgi:hypothetical protein
MSVRDANRAVGVPEGTMALQLPVKILTAFATITKPETTRKSGNLTK